jgi:DNA-binding transcriptional regulator YdaS (Cro superfamily)
MKLNAYLTKHDISERKFGECIGYSQASVNRYCNGRVPEPEAMRRILEVTNGEVTPNDFYAEAA